MYSYNMGIRTSWWVGNVIRGVSDYGIPGTYRYIESRWGGNPCAKNFGGKE